MSGATSRGVRTPAAVPAGRGSSPVGSIGPRSRLDRTSYCVAWLAASVAIAATLGYSIATIAIRPLSYTEGEILFDASRIVRGLPLYTDLVAGAGDYGAPPSRHVVAYLPVFAWLSAQLGAIATLTRALSFAAWTAAIAGIALTARHGSAPLARLGAALVFGSYTLAYWATSAQPDALALAFAGVALAITVRRGSIGMLGGALFTLAALLKPNVIGAFAGAALVELVLGRGRLVHAIAGAAVVAVPVIAVLQWISDGAWLPTLLHATLQPFSLELWATRMADKLVQFAPLLAFCLWIAARARRAPGMLHGLAALATSTAWALVTLGKVGSSSNYWIEPCLAALVVLANAPLPAMRPRLRAALVAVGLAHLAGTAAVSTWFAVHDADNARAQAAFLVEIRQRCAGAILSDDAGLEMQLDRRVIVSSFQLRWMVAAGQFPAAAWADTVADPAISCAVMQSRVLEQPADLDLDWHDGLGPEIRAAMKRRFILVERRAGLSFYRAR
jgi:hypothetical protein